MVDAATPLHPMPTADEFAEAGRRRARLFRLGGLLLALAVAGAYVGLGPAVDSPVLPVVLLICLLTPILLWHYPRMAPYAVFAAVCLFEIFPTSYSDALTDRVPFFWNVNTIFQTYAHVDFKGVPLNLFEIFILTAGACALLRAIYTKSVSLRGGPLVGPIAVYMGFVALGWINGMLTGGDFKISLQEVRSQFYFLLAYLMAVNTFRDRRAVSALLWTMVLCVGLKGILYTFRRYVTLAGQPLPDQGVGSHEEAFLFDAFVVLLLVLMLCGVHKRLQKVMWLLLPVVITGDLACNRRAATAALVIVIPVLLAAAYRALPDRRRLVGTLAVVLTVGWSIYYPAFKNSDSMFGQPARAIHSQFQPDARDAASNAYRDAENADLMATIRLSPLLGYGYGKRMLHAVPIADISQYDPWWDIITHNQILWVWMRVGTLGFFAFWLMIAAVLIRACLSIRGERIDGQTGDMETKMIGLYALLLTGMLVMFGLLDMQLVNFRDMLFTGLWVGMLGAAASQAGPVLSKKARQG